MDRNGQKDFKRMKLSDKQIYALSMLDDDIHTEIFYGGGAGGGKSWLGCVWLVTRCLKYPETRYLMGRAKLKILMESTYLSFVAVCKAFGLVKEIDWKQNYQKGNITFFNGSEIYMKDLFLYPRDPEFDSLGSTEYTGAFIDEASEITAKAKMIVTSRLRFKLEDYNLIPKLLVTSNPAKNFLYSQFYKPQQLGNIEPYRVFIPALVYDNPFISPHYIENLKKLDKNSRERLLHGNFEYDDDPAKLMEYDNIIAIFNREYDAEVMGYKRHLTCDVARFGKDEAVIMLWKGTYIEKIWSYGKCTTKELRLKLIELGNQYKIPLGRIIIDDDGIGGGIVDEMEGVIGFVNGSSPLDEDSETPLNYSNLKTQCAFKLAELVNNGKIGVYTGITEEIKEKITEELEQIKKKDVDKDDQKVRLVGKDVIRDNIGRSPDYADNMIMRMYSVIGEIPVLFGTLEM